MFRIKAVLVAFIILQISFSSAFAAEKPSAEEIQTRCDRLLALATAASPSTSDSPEFLARKRALEVAISQQTSKRHNVVHTTIVKHRQEWERLVFLLTRSEFEEILLMVRPKYYELMKQFELVKATAQQIEASKDAVEMGELRVKYEDASRAFGLAYGDFMGLWSTLESVAAGKGVEAIDGIPQEDEAGKFILSFDLAAKTAQSTAKHILGTINQDSEAKWIPNLQQVEQPQIEEIRVLFRHNIHALLAVLQQQLDEQKQSNKWPQRILKGLANIYLNITTPKFIPERYRKIALQFAGLAYDQLMVERHLDKIQGIVSIGRVQTANGNLGLSTSDTIINLQLKTLLEYDAISIGDDLLITFARISYHSDAWVHLVEAVAAKASAKDNASNYYTNLLARMQNAEKRAHELRPLPYMYDRPMNLELRLAVFQLAYLALSEEGIRHFFGASLGF